MLFDSFFLILHQGLRANENRLIDLIETYFEKKSTDPDNLQLILGIFLLQVCARNVWN